MKPPQAQHMDPLKGGPKEQRNQLPLSAHLPQRYSPGSQADLRSNPDSTTS